MSRNKALVFAVLALLIAVACLPAQIYGCMFPFLVIGTFFGIVAWHKHRRDTRIIAEAKQEQAATNHQLMLPPMTSKGSNRLFVPPPLERGK